MSCRSDRYTAQLPLCGRKRTKLERAVSSRPVHPAVCLPRQRPLPEEWTFLHRDALSTVRLRLRQQRMPPDSGPADRRVAREPASCLERHKRHRELGSRARTLVYGAGHERRWIGKQRDWLVEHRLRWQDIELDHRANGLHHHLPRAFRISARDDHTLLDCQHRTGI